MGSSSSFWLLGTSSVSELGVGGSEANQSQGGDSRRGLGVSLSGEGRLIIEGMRATGCRIKTRGGLCFSLLTGVAVLSRTERRTGETDSEGGADDSVELLPNDTVGLSEMDPGLFRGASSFASGPSSATTIAPVEVTHCTGLDDAACVLVVDFCDENHVVSERCAVLSACFLRPMSSFFVMQVQFASIWIFPTVT